MKKLKLPIPIFLENEIISEVEIKKPTSETIFQTKKIINTNNYFKALQEFILGSIESINENSDREYIKQKLSLLPVNSAEYLSIEIMLLQYPDDDFVEGVYNCPRCNSQKICEKSGDIDTRDSISELDINYCNGENEINIDINQVRITDINENDLIAPINNISFRFATMKDAIEAAAKVGAQNFTEIQKELFVKTLTRTNGFEIQKEEKKKYGQKIISKMEAVDLNKVSREISKYGLDNKVEKICDNCNKQWKAVINTTNFFVLALQ